MADARAEIDAYIAGLDEPQRGLLTALRATLRRAAPEAEEIITYSMPGIGQDGPLVSYRAWKSHCAFYPMGDAVFTGMADAIAPWRSSKGTLQFDADHPLPEALVLRMVQARLAENAGKKAKKNKR